MKGWQKISKSMQVKRWDVCVDIFVKNHGRVMNVWWHREQECWVTCFNERYFETNKETPVTHFL